MNILDVIFPRWCIGCGRKLVSGERFLCLHCLATLPRTDSSLAFVEYHSEGLTGKIVKAFKYRGKRELAQYCGRLMASEIQGSGLFNGIDAIVPVPLYWKRKLWRGYNQSELLARGISHVTGIPVCTNLLKRNRFDGSQTQLARWERVENVHGVFSLNVKKAPLFTGKHILLVDDVITVGATTNACREALDTIPGIEVSVLGFATANH